MKNTNDIKIRDQPLPSASSSSVAKLQKTQNLNINDENLPSELQKQFLDYLSSLIVEGVVNEDFHNLIYLKNESDPDSFINFLTLIFKETSVILDKLELNLKRENVDFLMLYKDLHDLMGHVSCIGAKNLKNACDAILSCAKMKNIEGSFKRFVAAKNEFFNVMRKLNFLFEVERKIVNAGGSIPKPGFIENEYKYHVNCLIDEGTLNNTFIELQLMQTESTPEAVAEILNIFFKYTQEKLEDLGALIKHEVLDFSMINTTLGELVEEGSSVGAEGFLRACAVLRLCTKDKNQEGCLRSWILLQRAYKMFKDKVENLLAMERTIAAAHGSISSIPKLPVNMKMGAAVAQCQFDFISCIDDLLDKGIVNNLFDELSSEQAISQLINDFFNDIETLLNEFTTILEQQNVDSTVLDNNEVFLQRFRYIRDQSSSIGLESVHNVLTDFIVFLEQNNVGGCNVCLVQLRNVYNQAKSEFNVLLILEKEIVQAGRSMSDLI